MSDRVRQKYQELSRLTVWQILEDTAARLPDKVAVIDGERRLTYSELLEESSRQADKLHAHGLGKGTVVAVYLPNSAQLVTLFYALQKLGAVIAWVNPNYRESEVRVILEKSGAEAIVLFQEWQDYDCLGGVLSLESVPRLENIIVCDASSESLVADPRVKSLGQVLESGARAAGVPEVESEDLSMLIFTSGTTGTPKGVMITQSQAVRAGYSYSLAVDASEDDVFIGFLPMSHSYGCGSLLVQPFLLGSTLVMLADFSPRKAFALIEKEKVTLQPAAPAHYILELGHKSREEYDLSSLRAGNIGGQAAPAGLIARVEEEMGVYISSMWGSSEVGAGLSLPYKTPLEVRERAVGYPLEGTKARVVDPETGEELDPGESGELLLEGWHVTQGYWGDPGETADQIPDGVLHTGDLAVKHEDGCFDILGRLKECVNRGGFKIIPSEVESLLLEHPEVAEVCVVGTPNPVLGESTCACVVPAGEVSEGALDLEGLRSFLDGRLADFKLPDELLVLEELPRMPGGVKVNRFGSGGLTELASDSDDKQTLFEDSLRFTRPRRYVDATSPILFLSPQDSGPGGRGARG